MEIHTITSSEVSDVREVAEKAFSATPDSNISDWFSFSEMENNISNGRGVCLKASVEKGKIAGMIYAQQENPINGKEGVEKWVIVILAVDPAVKGKGIGSNLLKEIEKIVIERNGSKLFVYTNNVDNVIKNTAS